MAECITATSITPTCVLPGSVTPTCITPVASPDSPALSIYSEDGLTLIGDSLDVGDVHIDETLDVVLRLTNSGSGTLVLGTVTVPADWTIVSGPTLLSLTSDEVSYLTLRFTPPG